MRKLLFVIVIGLVSCVVVAQNARYQPLNVKTGLWQVTVTTSVSGLPPMTPEMQAKFDQMTPEQRAQIMARFSGTPHTRTYKKCVKQEDLDKAPFSGKDEKCNWTLVDSSSSGIEIRGTACDAGKDQGMETDVAVKIHALDSENVKGTVQGTATGNGRTMNVSGTYSGKWLGGTCTAEAE